MILPTRAYIPVVVLMVESTVPYAEMSIDSFVCKLKCTEKQNTLIYNHHHIKKITIYNTFIIPEFLGEDVGLKRCDLVDLGSPDAMIGAVTELLLLLVGFTSLGGACGEGGFSDSSDREVIPLTPSEVDDS